MPTDISTKVMIGIIAAIMIGACLFLTRSFLAPVAFAFYLVAVVWPVQRRLQRWMSTGFAAVVTVLVSLAVVGAMLSLVVWSFRRVGAWLLANIGRFQALYAQADAWFEAHGFVMAGLITENFDVRWLLRVFQEVSGLLQSLSSFLVVMFLFMILGLLEVGVFRSQLAALRRYDAGRFLIEAGADMAGKMQKHMLVRSVVSLATGAVVWVFTLASGLELALAWGVIAFAMNYIPFIGPFVATLLPTLFALIQLESWRMALFVFLSLNVIQFVSGSYLEPRIAGKALAISPVLVLLAIFLWGFLWGIAGILLAVPFLIAALTLCAHAPSLRWVADLLSGQPREDTGPDAA